MPYPIVPLHKQESMPILFGEDQNGFQLSELQATLLKSTAATPNNNKYSANIVSLLKNIDQNTDFVVTAVTDSNERYCSVPSEIDDNTLISLKAEGLISGFGRSVKITERGRTALRDAYLKSDNSYRENKKSDRFDFRGFSRIAKKEGE